MKRKCLAVGIILLFVGTIIPTTAHDIVNVDSINTQIYPRINMATNRTLYVDDNNTEGPWNGTIEHPYQHINDATRNATDGDTVFVFNGTYNEQVYMETSVQLIGENKNSTIIDGGGSKGSTVVCHAHRITVSGFTIRRCGDWVNDAGVWIYDAWSHHSSYNTITGNIICHNNNDAICLYGSKYNVITNNIIKDNSGGVEISSSYNVFSNNTLINNSMRLGAAYFTTIIHNILVNGHIGIDGGDSNTIGENNLTRGDIYLIETTKNMVSNNSIYSGKISLEEIITPYNSDENIIYGNKFFGKSGIVISGAKKEHWIGHEINENTINGKSIEYFQNEIDTVFPNPYEVGQIILANCNRCVIHDFTISNVVYGIQLGYCTGIQIQSNYLGSNSIGILLFESQKNEIDSNIIVNNSGTGIFLEDSYLNDITHNNISHNNNGLSLQLSAGNKITRNNFVHNIQTTISYTVGPIPWIKNIFRNNYYSNHLGWIPYLFFGRFLTKYTYYNPYSEETYPIILPWLNIDWHPVILPYDIGL